MSKPDATEADSVARTSNLVSMLRSDADGLQEGHCLNPHLLAKDFHDAADEIEKLQREAAENRLEIQRSNARYIDAAAERDRLQRSREQERNYADVCYENQRLRAAIQWVATDAAYKAPEQIDVDMAHCWMSRLQQALNAVETAACTCAMNLGPNAYKNPDCPVHGRPAEETSGCEHNWNGMGPCPVCGKYTK